MIIHMDYLCIVNSSFKTEIAKSIDCWSLYKAHCVKICPNSVEFEDICKIWHEVFTPCNIIPPYSLPFNLPQEGCAHLFTGYPYITIDQCWSSETPSPNQKFYGNLSLPCLCAWWMLMFREAAKNILKGVFLFLKYFLLNKNQKIMLLNINSVNNCITSTWCKIAYDVMAI